MRASPNASESDHPAFRSVRDRQTWGSALADDSFHLRVSGRIPVPINSQALMRLLREKSDLSASVLERFEGKLCVPIGARLLGVELSEEVLTDMGYFID
jgi:hypothetical protein